MEQNGNTVIPLRSSLPEQCYVYVQTENEIGIVKKGESGYYKTDIEGGKPSERKALADEYNCKSGVTKAQAEAMKAGSMFAGIRPPLIRRITMRTALLQSRRIETKTMNDKEVF